MKVFLFSAMLLFAFTAAIADSGKSHLNCKAVFRSLDENNNTIEKSAEIPMKAVQGEEQKFALEFAGRFFGLSENLRNGDLFAQIASSPDFSKGSVTRGAVDSQGRFTATEVVGFTVYRMECSRGLR